MTDTIQNVIWLVLLIPSIVLHELAHAYSAWRLGDPTAKDAGRISLNPLKHIDPFGTVLLPLLLFAANAPIFGYAKPVPINPRYFRDLRKGELITGLSGPLTNFVLALVGAGVVRLMDLLPMSTVTGIVALLGSILVLVNLVLMFFNLIPIPPLDGASIWAFLLPDRALHTYYRIQQYSFGILLILLWVVPQFLNIDPIGAYFSVTVQPLARFLIG